MCLGIPGQILEITGSEKCTARVLISGVTRTVNVSLVCEDGIARGDWVLVHAGFALSKITEREAIETLALLREMSGAET